MNARTRRAVMLLEAANPVDPAVFAAPPLALDRLPATPAPRARGRHRSRIAVGVTAAVAVASAAVLVLPGTGDQDVIARAAAALGGDQIVFTEARKVEFGRVVSRELSWTTADGSRRRILVYTPDGRLESEIVDTPERASIFRPHARHADVFEGSGGPLAEFAGDPATLLARAREGRDGLRVIGEDRVDGHRVHVIQARLPGFPDGQGTTRITISAETYLPVSATIGLSTYQYDTIEKLPQRDDLLASTLTEERATVCVHQPPGSAASEPACTIRRWP